MPTNQPPSQPTSQTPPDYLHLAPGIAPPEMHGATPYRAVMVVEADAEMPWRLLVCDWLVRSGCLYVMAWGRDCELWHDGVDECTLAEFGFGDIPAERDVMTTWHDSEPLRDVFRFCAHSATHPAVELARTIIVHIAHQPDEARLLAACRTAADG
jgi:hypothetical protein